MVACQGVAKFVCADFFEAGIRNVSACSSRTSGYRDKQRGRLDLARQIGLETVLEVSLIVG